MLIGIALACAGMLRLVYSGTLFGLATSAVAENRRVAFRIFTREVAILEMHDGRYDVLSDDFVDILDPPDLS